MDSLNLLRHCTDSTVRDHLTRKRRSSYGLRVAPSDDVARSLYASSLDEAKRLAELVTSQSLLDELCTKEKRITVIRRLALNSNLPTAWRTKYQALAETKRDIELFTNLMLSAPVLEGCKLALGMHPLAHRVDDEARKEVLRRNITQDVLDLLDKEYVTASAVTLLDTAWGERSTLTPAEASILVKAATHSASVAHHTRVLTVALPFPEVHELLLEHGCTWKGTWHNVLRSRLERGVATTKDVVEAIQHDTEYFSDILWDLGQYSFPIEATIAEAVRHRAEDLIRRGLSSYWNSSVVVDLNVTPEAGRILARLKDSFVVSAFLEFVTDPYELKSIAETMTRDVLRDVELNPEVVAKAWEVGLDATTCLILVKGEDAVDQLVAIAPSFKDHIILHGGIYDATSAAKTVEDALLLLQRAGAHTTAESVQFNRQIGDKVLCIPGLDREDRLRAVKLLRPENIRLWLEGADKTSNPPQRGDFTDLLAWEPEIFTPSFVRAIWYSREASRGVIEDIVDTYPITQLSTAATPFQEEITRRLEQAFGSDTELWDTALVISENWHGNLQTLIEASTLC